LSCATQLVSLARARNYDIRRSKFYTACVMVAIKICTDGEEYTAKSFESRATTLKAINKRERELLALLDWHVHFDPFPYVVDDIRPHI